MAKRLIIVTGGPGAGKTTLLDALRAHGFPTMPDAARSIIRDQVRIGGRALSWIDDEAFAEMCLSWEMRSYQEALELPADIVFFDRGVPDMADYAPVRGRPRPPHLDRAIEEFRYEPRVLIAPPWPEIYETDSERTQTFDHAVRVFGSLSRTYPRMGYELVPLPLVSVAERVRFVRELFGI